MAKAEWTKRRETITVSLKGFDIFGMGRVKRKSAFKHAQNAHISDHSAHVQSIIRAFVLHSYIM